LLGQTLGGQADQDLPTIFASRTDTLSPRMLRVIEDLSGDWHRLDERIESLSEINAPAARDAVCQRLMTASGLARS
jgi:transposase